MKAHTFVAVIACCLAATSLFAGDAKAKPPVVEKCADTPLPVDFDPTSAASVRKALKGSARIFFVRLQKNHAALQQLLAGGENANVCALGSSVLAYSAAAGELEEVTILLDGGADPDRPFAAGGSTPLFNALGAGHFDVAKLLLARGANPLHKTDGGLTALHELAIANLRGNASSKQLEMASELIFRGAPVNSQMDIQRTTPLMMAALRGNVALVDLLLRSGADAKLANAKGETAVTFANRRGHRESADRLNLALSKP